MKLDPESLYMLEPSPLDDALAKAMVGTAFAGHEKKRSFVKIAHDEGLPRWVVSGIYDRATWRREHKVPDDEHDEGGRLEAARVGYDLPATYKGEYVYIHRFEVDMASDTIRAQGATASHDVWFTIAKNPEDPTNITYLHHEDKPRSGF